MTLREVANMLEDLYNGYINVRFCRGFNPAMGRVDYVNEWGTTEEMLQKYGNKKVEKIVNQENSIIAFLADE